ELGRLRGCADRLQVVETVPARNSAGHICDTLRRLAQRDGGDHFVVSCTDGGGGIRVLEPDIDARAISGGPQPMRQCAGLYCRDLVEVRGAKDFDHVKPADRYISELAPRSAYEIDVIGDRTGIKHLYHVERR